MALWNSVSTSQAIEAPTISGLTADEQEALNRLFKVWSDKLHRNRIKNRYYDGKNRLKDLGIAVPPNLRYVETVVGWPAKAVDMLAARSRFDGFTFSSEVDDSSLDAVLAENSFKTMYSRLVTSELINSCSFVTVSAGYQGEPEVVIIDHSALWCSAIWDSRKKRIECGLVINACINSKPTVFTMFTDNAIIEAWTDGYRWKCERVEHGIGRPLMEPLVYRPTIDRPFGKSRINRAVMSITDSAVREALRTEISSEFFTTPQKYLIGTENDLLKDVNKWDAYIGNIFAVSKDGDGESPQFGQLPQGTMQPHMDYIRSLAARFSGETCIPISSLGVIHDNPSSAEAIYAAKEDLVIEAENLNSTNGNSLRNIGLICLAILNRCSIDDLPAELKTISPRFKNPAMPSIVSQSDAMVKQASVAPYLAETEVFLEELGYNEEQRTRILNEKKRSSAGFSLMRMMEGNDAGSDV